MTSNQALPTLETLWQDSIAWQPSESQQAQFQHLYEQILAGNQQLNLTRITDATEFWEKHLWDSISGIARWLYSQPASLNVIDIGTGAGFPGLPVAIVQPTWSVTLLDSTRKKIQFLDRLLETLAIANAKTLVDRVEAIGHQPRHRSAYDLALIRAVATASVCAEYVLPLLKTGGSAVLYRGQWTSEETNDLQPVVEQLGGTVAHIDSFKTPVTAGDRHCIHLTKIAPTPPDFPRAIGVPAQKPLT